MISRRDFLLSGCAASALLVPTIGTGQELSSTAAARSRSGALYTLVYDRRFASSEAFGRYGSQHGIPVSPIRGDVTRLWYDDLHYRWRTGPAAIAGMTTAGAFFCLETLGNDVGLRRAFAIEHDSVSNGRLRHSFSGPSRLLERLGSLHRAAAWEKEILELALDCTAPSQRREDTTAIVECLPHRTPIDPVSLVTWALVPVERRA